MPSLLRPNAFKRLDSLRRNDPAFLAKRKRLIWYGGLSGPLPFGTNVRCRFVAGAPTILDRLGLPHDIKFTNLCDRAALFQPQFGRYEPGHIRPEEQLGERFLVALDGCGQPGNLNWVFVTNSLVFRNRSSWHCLFDELFAPGDDSVQFNSDLSDFEQVVSFALNHEDEVQQIIACSTRKMKTVTLELIHDWMRATLRRCQFKQPNCLL